MAVANQFLSSEGVHFCILAVSAAKSQRVNKLSSFIFFGTFSSYGIVQEQSLDYFFPGAISAIHSKLSITKIHAELRATFPS